LVIIPANQVLLNFDIGSNQTNIKKKIDNQKYTIFHSYDSEYQTKDPLNKIGSSVICNKRFRIHSNTCIKNQKYHISSIVRAFGGCFGDHFRIHWGSFWCQITRF